MKRLYFLIPDANIAKRVVDDLLLQRVTERHIHIVAKDEHLLEQNDLPKAGLLQERDVVPALQRGITIGGATGLIAGLLAVSFPPAGLALGGGAILATTLGGAAFGAVVGPMIGISAPNSQLKKFEEAVNAGALLMMLDIPAKEVDKFSKRIQSHYPDVDIGGTEPTKPPFP